MEDVTLANRETLCELLKRATQVDHGSAEKASPMTRLMSEDVELADYADALRRLVLLRMPSQSARWPRVSSGWTSTVRSWATL